jgi:hypothetical protein
MCAYPFEDACYGFCRRVRTVEHADDLLKQPQVGVGLGQGRLDVFTLGHDAGMIGTTGDLNG